MASIGRLTASSGAFFQCVQLQPLAAVLILKQAASNVSLKQQLGKSAAALFFLLPALRRPRPRGVSSGGAWLGWPSGGSACRRPGPPRRNDRRLSSSRGISAEVATLHCWPCQRKIGVIVFFEMLHIQTFASSRPLMSHIVASALCERSEITVGPLVVISERKPAQSGEMDADCP